MDQQQKMTPSVPVPTKLPPRPSGLKAQPPMTPQPNKEMASTGTASSGSLKLVHAPILSDDESDGELSTADMDDTGVQATTETQFDPEASLSLPSNVRFFSNLSGYPS